ncbi:MAG: polysaccharide biosynthesis protein [Paracoccaceae bacterium]
MERPRLWPLRWCFGAHRSWGVWRCRGATTRIYQAKTTRARVLIYGAGQTGRQLAAALATDDKLIPVGFVDDNPTLHTMRLAGLPVHGPAALPHLVASRNIDRILLTMPSVSPARRAQITAELRGVGCPVYAIPAFAQLSASDLTSPSSAESLGGANQFLGRPALDPIFPCSANAFRGRRILVTGAGGSIGSELCRQVLANDPASVVLVDHCELALFNSHRQLCDTARDTIGDLPVHPVLGSVCDAGLMAQVLADYEIDVVLHAAAYKHVSLVEQNIVVGVTNNVLGTRTLAEAAREAGVERFILISSDKAVRPANAMGATKRLAELVVQTLAKGGGRTRFAIVRFGNVLGSSGSVIPIFAEQIARGGPVTVTHPQVKRYFMTVEEATRLVLLAGATAQGGEVFVLDMGAPVPIADLARQMICAAGLRVRDKDCPDGDVEIALTGLRPGEKLQEELFITGDGLPTSHAKILRVQENGLSELETARLLADLRTTTQARDADAVKAVLDQWVEPQTTAFSIAGE